MYLTRHETPTGPRWALDEHFLPRELCLATLLALPRAALETFVTALPRPERATGNLLSPVDPTHEIWAAGVTYLRSREAREAESTVKDVYSKVYDAERPEIFFKALGFRAAGHEAPIRTRRDSRWNVPEPELVLVVNAHREIVGYSAGNDVSSRDIEGENPLYLPQAKVYEGSCALGPGIVLAGSDRLGDLPIRLRVIRDGRDVFQGETATSRMKRGFEELVAYLTSELTFSAGAFLFTGTGIVPAEDFSLSVGDTVEIGVGDLQLRNRVERSQPLVHYSLLRDRKPLIG